MTQHYMIAVAGNAVNGHPRVVDVTQVPEAMWPVWDQAFGGKRPEWMYTPAAEAIPRVQSAIAMITDSPGQKKVLSRLLSALQQYDDSVIAWGVEDDLGDVWG